MTNTNECSKKRVRKTKTCLTFTTEILKVNDKLQEKIRVDVGYSGIVKPIR